MKCPSILACAHFVVFFSKTSCTQRSDLEGEVIPSFGGVLKSTQQLTQFPNDMLLIHPLKEDELDDQFSGIPLSLFSNRIRSVFNMYDADNARSEKSLTHPQATHPYYDIAESSFNFHEMEFKSLIINN